MTQSSSEYSIDDARNSDRDVSKKVFSKQVENVVIRSDGEISFLDAILSLAEIHSIDPAECASYLTDDIIQSIKVDVAKENKIRKANRNDLFNESDPDPDTVRLHDFWL